jgi:hypothetical protein
MLTVARVSGAEIPGEPTALGAAGIDAEMGTETVFASVAVTAGTSA